ncbi:MAG: thymidine phosphorylase [Wenzhouxiangellaceae bacterium]|nr:thymidine phosphorylase [Wenzhouxiangellaceae bacterium]
MLPQEVIAAKRDGRELADEAIATFVRGIADGNVADEQLGAFAMAVLLKGMSAVETRALTLAMRDSGRVLRWPDLPGPVLDKHSTGGVGDTVSLILGPWVAACGGFVPMISGRGLGHTGGTLDKLASIPGYDPFPSPDALARIVADIGVAIIGQTDDLAPADRRFYAVRDVTATVECLPLIVASILSKKLAAGLDALVMDVKTGSGSVMGAPARATELAHAIAEIAAEAGLPTTALVTDMNQVLARSAGNALEVAEAIDVLTGRVKNGRLLELTRELAIEMLRAGGLAEDRDAAGERLDRALAAGEVAERFARMVSALGGPDDLLDAPVRHLPQAAHIIDVPIETPGFDGAYVGAIDVREVGLAVVELGGGRTRADQSIDPAVGLDRIAGLGDRIEPGQPIARIHAHDEDSARRAATRLQQAFELQPEAPAPPALIIERICS